MTKYTSYLKRLLPVLPAVSLLLFTGCHREDLPVPAPAEKDESWVNFNLNVPGIQTPTLLTKGMQGDPESDIRTIDLLVFEKWPEMDTEHFYYRERISLSKANGDFTQSGSDIEFKAKLGIRNNETSIMILANLKSFIDENLYWLEPYAIDHTKKFILDCLLYENTTGSWQTGTNYTPIPMYGEKNLASVAPTMTTISDIALRRMLARIDIRNSAGNFTLESVSQVNYHYAGKISPPYDANGNVDLESSFPLTVGTTYLNAGWDLRNEYPYVAGTNGMEGEIYTAESQSQESFLILKGKITGDNNYYYYRIDFVNPNNGNTRMTEYLPVLRNHRYVFTISKVTGVGYLSPQEAIAAPSAVLNLETELLVYDLSELSSIVYNGHYMLGVNRDQAHFSAAQETEYLSIPVFTNAPGGWTATRTEGDWFVFAQWVTPPDYPEEETTTITGPSNHHNSSDNYNLSRIMLKTRPFTSATQNGQMRTGKIKVTSNGGRLSLYINITQTYTMTNEPLTITLLDENGKELPYTLDVYSQKEYVLEFGKHIGQSSVPARRIYVKPSATAANRVILGLTAYSIASQLGLPESTHIDMVSYVHPDPNPYSIGLNTIYRGTDWNSGIWYYETLKPIDIQPTPRTSSESSLEFWDILRFPVLTSDWNTNTSVFLKIHQK